MRKACKLVALILRYHDIVYMDYLREEEKPLERFLSRCFKTEEDMWDYYDMVDGDTLLPPTVDEKELDEYFRTYYELGRGYYLYGRKQDERLSL